MRFFFEIFKGITYSPVCVCVCHVARYTKKGKLLQTHFFGLVSYYFTYKPCAYLFSQKIETIFNKNYIIDDLDTPTFCFLTLESYEVKVERNKNVRVHRF